MRDVNNKKLKNIYTTTPTTIPPTNHTVICKADSGATRNYFTERDAYILNQKQEIKNGPKVGLPNGTTLEAHLRGNIPDSNLLNGTTLANYLRGNILTSNLLTPKALQAHVFKGLTNSSLISIGQLCDDGCIAMFDKKKLHVFKKDNLVITGTRNTYDGLWDISISKNNTLPENQKHTTEYLNPSANVIIRANQTKSNLAEYLHKCAFSPTLRTLTNAISKGHLITWPGIENLNFKKLIRNLLPTAKGHLDQERKNLQSTKVNQTDEQSDDLDYNPTDGVGIKTYEYASSIINITPKGTTYTDLTGRFPHRSSRGNEYFYVMYDYDSNAILAAPIKNRQSLTIVNAWNTLHTTLTKFGHETKHFVLDNECSKDLKEALKKNGKTFERTPPNIHRRNAAERAIRTYKNHFLAGLATCDPDFPLGEWDRLIPQSVITLNLLRTSRVNTKLSAYAYLFGNYDFNKCPLAPPGTKALLHKKTKDRKSWEYHGKKGWTIGPSLEHYRCIRCYNPDTLSEVDTDTLDLIPNVTPIPKFSDTDAIKQAVSDIVHILRHPSKNNIPTVFKGDKVQEAFSKVATLLSRNSTTEPPPLKTYTTPVPRVPIKTKLTKGYYNNTAPEPRVISSKKVFSPNVHTSTNPSDTFTNFLKTSVTVPTIIPRSPFPRITTNLPNSKMHNPNWLAYHIFDERGKKQSIDNLLAGPDSKTWQRSTANELGRLADGIPGRVKGTGTIGFLHRRDIPRGRTVTYSNFVCDLKPLKDEKHRVRVTIGGDRLTYDHETAAPTAGLLDTKIIINSTISDAKKGARFMSLDLKNFFLQTPLPPDEREYMRIHGKYFDKELRDLYNLESLIDSDGYVYCEVKLGMYGLKQAAILAFKQLKKRLEAKGYRQLEESNGIWEHSTRKINFCLCVDDFGVKYFSKNDADHLISTLEEFYEVSKDWTGTNYCGLTFDWHYSENYVDVYLPDFVIPALAALGHPKPKRPQHAPHRWNRPVYGQKVQLANLPDKSKLLDKKETTRIQRIVGLFLYYARALESPILPALNDIGQQQAKPTVNTKKEAEWLMDFLWTYPNARLRYFAGTMQLAVDSDASFLTQPGAKSRYAGHFYFESLPHPLNYNGAPNNAPIHTACATIKNVVASVAESECSGVFNNAQEALVISRIATALNHKQKPTPLKTDNSTAYGYVSSSMRNKRSKAWDMRFHWLRQDALKKFLKVFWDRGSNNHADYYTKHHSPSHHKETRPTYILKGYSVTDLRTTQVQPRFGQGCVYPVSSSPI